MIAAVNAATRDYSELFNRVNALPRHDWRVELHGEVSGYPFLAVRRDVAVDAPTVLLTAGMHGDEPAGVEAVLRWLESREAERWRVNWRVLPCLNPFGWTHNQRTNATGQDINRQFRNSSDCPEAELIKRLTRRLRLVLAMDFHEDADADGYYLCETAGQSDHLGERIVAAVRRVIPISRAPVLDGRRATAPGLVRRIARPGELRRRKQWPLAFHLISCCAAHFLCSETPTDFPLSRRIAAHHAALQAALETAIGGGDS